MKSAPKVEKAGFEVEVNEYVHRRTVNVKENVDVPRIFVQAKFRLKS
jgi:methyltransferase-like protein 6